MSALGWLGVAGLGGLGALARFALDAAVSARAGGGFPWGTLAVNVTGAFLLGTLAGLHPGREAELLAGAGLLGSYTTFSTWMFETHRLAEDGRSALGALDVAASLAAGLAAVALGRLLGGAL